MFDIHPVRQFQQPVHQVVGAEEHLDPALRRPLLDGLVRRSVGQEEHRDDEDLETEGPVHRVPDGDGGVPGVGERAGHVLRPLDLGTETGPVLEPGEEVQLGGLRQRLQFVQGVAGKAAPGKLVVDDGLGAAPGVLAPVRGKCGLYFHLMIGPSSRGRDRGGDESQGRRPSDVATPLGNFRRLTDARGSESGLLTAWPGEEECWLAHLSAEIRDVSADPTTGTCAQCYRRTLM